MPILDMKRLVRLVKGLELLDVAGIHLGVHGHIQSGGIARGQVHDEEAQDRYPQEERNHRQKPSQQEFSHVLKSKTLLRSLPGTNLVTKQPKFMGGLSFL